MAAEHKTEAVIQSNESTIEEQPRYYFEDIEAHLDAMLEQEKKHHKRKWQILLDHMMRNGIPVEKSNLICHTAGVGVMLVLTSNCEISMSHGDEFYADIGTYSNHCSPDDIMKRLGLPPVRPQCTKYKQTTLCVKDDSPAGQ